MVNSELRYVFNGIDQERFVIATYFIVADAQDDIVARIGKVANILYPGTWTPVIGESPEAHERHAPRILGVYETPPYETSIPENVRQRHLVAQVAIPLLNLDDTLAALLSAVIGELMAYDNVKLLDLYMPRPYAIQFKGPTLGVAGIRERLDVHDRPLVLAIFKPSQGYTAKQGAEIFYEAAAGGADIVKDDELLTNPDYCRREERVRRYMAMERRAFEETGEHTLYTVNVTDRPDKLIDNALKAIDLGVNALMVNYMLVGLDATRLLCEDPRVTVPVLGHNTGAFPLYSNPYSGMSITLSNGLLPRLAGVDLGILLIQGGSYPALPDRCLLLAREMLSPFYDIQQMLPILAAGVTPGLVDVLLETYGQDVALGSGSCIFGHPQGPRAGAKAFRQAISAVKSEQPLDDTAAEYTELRAAIQKWGPHQEIRGNA
jgi:2,3-diketo-5-methylthiopentyl-1-phosphate enolase